MRTSEKERDDVLAEINRVLGKGREDRTDLPPDQRKSLLVTVDLASYRVLPDEKTAASGGRSGSPKSLRPKQGAGGSPLGVLAQLFAASRVAEPETTARTVAFSFVEKKEDPETHQIIIVPAFTSRASVAMFFTQLMEKKAKELGEAGEKSRQNTMESAAKQMSIDGLGKDNEGRFQWMELHLQEPLKGESLADFKSVLADAKDQFGHQPLARTAGELRQPARHRHAVAGHVRHPGELGRDPALPVVPLRQLDVRRGGGALPDPRPVLHAGHDRVLPLHPRHGLRPDVAGWRTSRSTCRRWPPC